MTLNKLKFFLTKPTLILILGQEKEKIKKIILQILEKHFVINKEVFVFAIDERKINEFSFFFKNSKLPILAINDLNQKFSFDNLPLLVHFVLNYDDQKVREMKIFDSSKSIKFGLNEKYDIFISDIKEGEETNLKINYKGSVVPFWFKKKLNEKERNIVLSVISIATVLGLNLVEISQSLKEVDFY